MHRFLCLYFPRWPLQRFLASQTDNENPQPIALFERSAHGPRIAVCSVEANKLGVKRGMLMADATSLAPDLILHEIDRTADREALEKLALWCGRFSPLVGVENTSPPTPLHQGERGELHPQSLQLDVTGCAQVFDGEENLIRQALKALAKKKLKARAAIAPTIGGAWALAHYGANAAIIEEAASPSRPVAQSPSQSVSPLHPFAPSPIQSPSVNRAGETPAVPGSPRLPVPQSPSQSVSPLRPFSPSPLQEVLAPLPLPALRIDADAVIWLNKLGIYKIGELLKQPRSTLPSRFGPQLIERLDQALGHAAENMPLLRPPPEIHAACAFEYPLRSLDLLLNVLEKIVAQITHELQTRCRGARHLECWLYHEIAEPVLVDVTLFKASASSKHLMQLLRTRLEDFCHKLALKASKKSHSSSRRIQASLFDSPNQPPNADRIRLEADDGLMAVALHVIASEPLDAEQLALFHNALRAPEELSLTLDRITTRLGPLAAMRARLIDQIQPEDAFKLVALSESPQIAPASRNEDLSPRPLHIFQTPQPINVDWPTDSELPKSFNWREARFEIIQTSGRERIETAWWKPDVAQRDYYVFTTSNGSRYWIFQRLTDAQWFVHGLFA